MQALAALRDQHGKGAGRNAEPCEREKDVKACVKAGLALINAVALHVADFDTQDPHAERRGPFREAINAVDDVCDESEQREDKRAKADGDNHKADADREDQGRVDHPRE